MKILKIAAIVVAAVVVLVVGIGFVLPAELRMERETVIEAPPSAVYAELIAPKRHLGWSPWAKLDPNIEWTFEGPESGVGAKYSWISEAVGNGSQEITEAVENEKVVTALEFGDSRSVADFQLSPVGEGNTKVVWGFESDAGANPFARWFNLFVEGFLGEDYEKGLANLKGVVEKGV